MNSVDDEGTRRWLSEVEKKNQHEYVIAVIYTVSSRAGTTANNGVKT